MNAVTDVYFNAYRSLKLTRDAFGVLVAEFYSKGGPFTFTAKDHTEFIDVFYRISQDRANKTVLLTGSGGEFIPEIDFSSFGDVVDPLVLEPDSRRRCANSRKRRQHTRAGNRRGRGTGACAFRICAACKCNRGGGGGNLSRSAALRCRHCARGRNLHTWSYRAGAGRAEAFLLNPQPLLVRTAHEWGVVAELVQNGKALSRARELAELYLKAPEVTRRNTRVYFIHPLKERIVREVGYELLLEGASAADLVRSIQAGTKHAHSK